MMDSTDQLDETVDDSINEPAQPGPALKKAAAAKKRGRPAKQTKAKSTAKLTFTKRVVTENQNTEALSHTQSFTEDEATRSHVDETAGGVTDEDEASQTEGEESQSGEESESEAEVEEPVVEPAGNESAKSKAAPKKNVKNIKDTNKNQKRRKVRPSNYTTYIYRVHRQLHKDLAISNKSMEIMNSFINDMFERIATEAASLAKLNRKQTLGSNEIQTATRLALGYNSLGDHAVAEGMKALALYKRNSELK